MMAFTLCSKVALLLTSRRRAPSRHAAAERSALRGEAVRASFRIAIENLAVFEEVAEKDASLLGRLGSRNEFRVSWEAVRAVAFLQALFFERYATSGRALVRGLSRACAARLDDCSETSSFKTRFNPSALDFKRAFLI